MSLMEEPTLSTLDIFLSNNSNSSAGNASTAFECTNAMRLRLMHLDSITMGQRSRFLNKNHPWSFVPMIQLAPYKVKDSFDYSLTRAQMPLWLRDQPYQKALLQSCLVIPKLVRTLTGGLKMQEVVMMQTLRFPKLDKNRRINQQKVLVFDNNNVRQTMSNTTSSWVQTFFPRLEWSWTTQRETWNGLIAPSHFVNLEVWIQMNSMPSKTCFTSKSKTSSLVKIGSNALQQRFWMPSMKGQM